MKNKRNAIIEKLNLHHGTIDLCTTADVEEILLENRKYRSKTLQREHQHCFLNMEGEKQRHE